MTAVGTVVLGHVVVLLDLRVPGFDVLPDPLGWLVVAVGLTRLTGLDARFSRVRALALVTAVLSVADLVHPVVERAGSSAAVAPTGLQGGVSLAATVVAIATDVLLCLVLRDRAQAHGEPATASRFTVLAGLQVALGVALLALQPLGPDPDVTGGLAAVVVVLALGGLALAVAFLLALGGVRTRPWLDPGPGRAPDADRAQR